MSDTSQSARRFSRRIWLFVRIVFRIDHSETRMMPGLAWEVAGIIHPSKAKGLQ